MQGKAFERIQHAFMLKVLEKGLELTYFNTIKTIYVKSIANSNINGGKLEAIPLESGNDLMIY